MYKILSVITETHIFIEFLEINSFGPEYLLKHDPTHVCESQCIIIINKRIIMPIFNFK